MAGVRTAWTTIEDGDFFCPGCGGDRNYERRVGHRRLTVLGLPLLTRGEVAPVVVCSSCDRHHGPEALDQPTTTRLASMLRDAVHTVALAVLSAGGARSRTARLAAVGSMRAAGFTACDEEQLLTLLVALSADRAASGADLADLADEPELRRVLEPLSVHLAPAGREALLLQGARIALADGPYEAEELAALSALGRALRIPVADVDRLLAAAPERS
ncbi:TerB family tellurite resistance protein [Streptomyces durbertensis]|uniref:TerB family tellurite resistance protein n=1 Tax=Streptomyces durbertensis TaxID=2448886 RepID=A0ABR6EJH2_9ACTN|nr:TerB family tellurite resistance protein [Streptomyces durbertensis]